MSTSAEQEVLRSIARLVKAALPFNSTPGHVDHWRIERTVEQASRVNSRPIALVEQAAAVSVESAGSMHTVTMPVTITLLLAGRDTRREALEAAQDAGALVREAILFGSDPSRSTPNLIERWRLDPRDEQHRIRVKADGGTWVATLDAPSGSGSTAALPPNASASSVRTQIVAALTAAGLTITSADVQVNERAPGWWDITFVGAQAGRRVADITVNGSGLQRTYEEPEAAGEVLVQGCAAPWRAPSDWIRVTSLTVSRPLPDQDDPTLMAVPIDLRCTFARGPRLRSSGRAITGLSVTFDQG